MINIFEERMDKQEAFHKELLSVMADHDMRPIKDYEIECMVAMKDQKKAFNENIRKIKQEHGDITFDEWIRRKNYVSWRERPYVKKRIKRASKRASKNS